MTNYFKKCKTRDEVKKTYKKLALINHPDKGGDDIIMKEINAQFEVAFLLYPSLTNSSESANSFKCEFYTRHGYSGKNYNPYRTNKELAKIIRMYVKSKWNDCRFSITSNYLAIHVSLKEAPFDLLNEEETDKYLKRNNMINTNYQLTKQQLLDSIRNGSKDYRFIDRGPKPEYLSKEIYEIIYDVQQFVQTYHMDDSDAQIDYFNTNFYFHLAIGKWDKPYKKVFRKRKELSLSIA